MKFLSSIQRKGKIKISFFQHFRKKFSTGVLIFIFWVYHVSSCYRYAYTMKHAIGLNLPQANKHHLFFFSFSKPKRVGEMSGIDSI
jgi:hypothetical protein